MIYMCVMLLNDNNYVMLTALQRYFTILLMLFTLLKRLTNRNIDEIINNDDKDSF